MRNYSIALLSAVAAIFLTACGSTSTETVTATIAPTTAGPTKQATATKQPTSTSRPTSTPRPPATLKPTKTATPEQTLAPTNAPFSGATISYVDPAGDCIDNNTSKYIICDPLGFDILTATVSRPSETAPLYIIVQLAGQGVADIPRYALMYAFDFDRDATTGDTKFPPDHGIAPELEIIVDHGIGQAGKLNIYVTQFAADGTKTNGDSTLVEYVVRADDNLAVVISPDLVPGNQFNMSADMIGSAMFDHIVDHGSLQFQEGTTALVK
ncbi:MAG TPA: hypothetical protein VFF70_06345 [Anaerolineae bacterium]|nr:hypothetical protein [Anaerolineae bacterium]